MTTFTNRRCLVVPVLSLLMSLGGLLSALPADAAVYRWDNGALITDLPVGALAESVGMDLSYANLVGAVLVNRFLRPPGLDATRTPISGYRSLCDFAEAIAAKSGWISVTLPPFRPC
jgi:hypothetical protein